MQAACLRVVKGRTRFFRSLLSPGIGCRGPCRCCRCSCRCCRCSCRCCQCCRRFCRCCPSSRSRKTYTIFSGVGQDKIKFYAPPERAGNSAEFTVSASAISWQLRVFCPPLSPPFFLLGWIVHRNRSAFAFCRFPVLRRAPLVGHVPLASLPFRRPAFAGSVRLPAFVAGAAAASFADSVPQKKKPNSFEEPFGLTSGPKAQYARFYCWARVRFR